MTSWLCSLVIDPSILPEEKKDQIYQLSPLRFATEEEANIFGTAMFNPPLTVKQWRVIESASPANCEYKNGLLKIDNKVMA
jgi:hypothetical protein